MYNSKRRHEINVRVYKRVFVNGTVEKVNYCSGRVGYNCLNNFS